MFLARRPSNATIDQFLRVSQSLPLSYGPIGIVKGETARDDLDEQIVCIGRGRTDFERARAALLAWTQFDIGWVDTFPRHAPIAVLTNHAESGEELFEVFIDPGTDEVMYRIRATSQPQAMLARVGQPIVRVLQARFRRHSAEVMKRAVHLRI